jgi:hypothetical protein
VTSIVPSEDDPATVAVRFEEFHAQNPHVYRILVSLADQWLAEHPGRPLVGIDVMFGKARWDVMFSTGDADYKLRNDFKPFYARLMLHDEPRLAGMFTLRRCWASGADEWIADYARRHRRDHLVAVPTQHNHNPERYDRMTGLTSDGNTTPRVTRTMNYPLPPEPPRVAAVYDGWGRYKLPHPTTGRPTGFTRATTVAGTLDDTYNLSRWARRETARFLVGAMTDDSPIVSPIVDAFSEDDKGAIDAALDALDDACGGKDAAELGTAVHAWLEAVDLGAVRPVDVPERFAPYVRSYRQVLARYGLVAEPRYVERIVLNDRGEETIVGTLDRVYRVAATGELILGDVKTSKTLEYGYLAYSVQLAIYGHATRMFAADGSGWEPMPTINTDYALIIHVPSDQPERAEAVTIDLKFGADTMTVALDARRRRKQAKKAVPFVHAIPAPTAESLRHVAARHAIQDISDPAQLSGIWEEFADVWSDELTALGEQFAELLLTSQEEG